MKNAELEKALYRGIVKGGLLLALILFVMWYFVPIALPLVVVWVSHLLDRVIHNPFQYLKSGLFVAVLIFVPHGLLWYLTKKKLWIFREENPQGMKLYLGTAKLLLLIFIWTAGLIFFAINWL